MCESLEENCMNCKLQAACEFETAVVGLPIICSVLKFIYGLVRTLFEVC